MKHKPSLAAVASALAIPLVAASADTISLAETGDTIGTGNVLFAFDAPLINDAGDVAFRGIAASVRNGRAGGDGIFLTDTLGGGIATIVQPDDPAPDGNGRFLGVSNPSLNAVGQVSFNAFLENTAGALTNTGVFRGDGVALTQLARGGPATPDGNGVLAEFFSSTLADDGTAVFRGRANNTVRGSGDDTGIFSSSGGAITQVVRANARNPADNARIDFVSTPDVNALGQVVIDAQLVVDGGGRASGVYVYDDGALRTVADPAGFNASPFPVIGRSVINDVGQVAFAGSQLEPGSTEGGLYLNTPDGVGGFSRTSLLTSGDAAPGGGTYFSIFGESVQVNNAGRVSFLPNIDIGAAETSEAIAYADTAGVTVVVREGEATPSGDFLFRRFFDLDRLYGGALNDLGQIAFLADLDDPATGGLFDARGLFLFDPQDGLIEIARTGGELFGSTIDEIDFLTPALPGSNGSGLNNRGDVVFSYLLDDRRRGIALFNGAAIPEPASVVTGGLVLALLATRRRRSA